jgi:hypothetical protein
MNKKCNVNFMWYSEDEKFDTKIIDDKIIKWKDDNIELICWYNNKTAISNDNVKFIHLNSLPLYETIHKNIKMNLYFKVDLFKLCIALYNLETYVNDYFLFTDIDIEPMKYTEIFDKKLLNI